MKVLSSIRKHYKACLIFAGLSIIIVSLGLNAIIIPWYDKQQMKAKIKDVLPLEAYGDITNAVIDSWEFNDLEGKAYNPNSLLRLGTSQYYLTSLYGDTGTDSDGFLRVIKVWNDNGTFVKTLVDEWEFDTSDGGYEGLCHISGDIYAVIYNDVGSTIAKIITTTVWESNGTCKRDIIDTFNLAYQFYFYPSLIHVTGNVYAASYQENMGGYDHQLETVEITTAGVITDARLDIQEVDATSTDFTSGAPAIVMIDSDTIAYVWFESVGHDGFLATYNISAAGLITNTPADTWEFDSGYAGYPFIYNVGTNMYAISYVDTDLDGWVKTVAIADNGAITRAFTDTLQFADANTVLRPVMFTVNAGSVYGVTWEDSTTAGRVTTMNISSIGVIGNAIIDELVFDATDDLFYAPVVYVNESYYLIVYSGTGTDGFACTVEISTDYSQPEPPTGRTAANVFDYYFYFANESIRTSTGVFNYYFYFKNESIRTSTELLDYYFYMGNESERTDTTVFDNYFVFGNESIPRNSTNIFDYFFYFGNESIPRNSTNVFNYYFYFANESYRNPTLLFDYYFYLGNESTARNETEIFDYYFYFGNESTINSTELFDYYFGFGNESVIGLSNPHPTGTLLISIDSNNISGHTGDITVSIQRNHTGGLDMNTSIWFNGTFLFTNTTWGNGTITFWLFDHYNGSLVSGHTYTWVVNCSSGSEYTNETYSFTPRAQNMVLLFGRDRFNMGFILGTLLFLMLGLILFKRRK